MDILLGLLLLTVGAAFAFRGYLAMRVIIPLWGSLVGFLVGAGFTAALLDEGFLASLTAWLVGLGIGLLFGLLAYLYYELSVVLSMGAIGFALGTGLVTALGVSWSWVIVLVGAVAGVLLAFVAIATDLPMALLAVLTALGGSSVAVAGLMLLVGIINTGDLGNGATTRTLDDDWWWYAIYLGIALAGMITQFSNEALRRDTLRGSWESSGGRTMRA